MLTLIILLKKELIDFYREEVVLSATHHLKVMGL